MSTFDLIVIGTGPGGYVAAIRAAQLGLNVAVVEKDPAFGGTCLHRGCIPTKAWLHTASLIDEIRHAKTFGVKAGAASFDGAGARTFRQGVIDKNAKGIAYLFKKNKIKTYQGFGRLKAAGEVEVTAPDGSTVLEGRFVLIATGSTPRAFASMPVDQKKVFDSDGILALEKVPKSLVVLGAGAVGVEFASIFKSLGSEVTLVEKLDRLLPVEDADVSKELARAFKKRGIKLVLGVGVERVEPSKKGATVTLEGDGEAIEAEKVLVAIGRAPVIQDIGLEAAGVELRDGVIAVDAWMRTSVPSIYAIGDVVRAPWLAHKASAEGVLAAEHMAGAEGVEPLDYDRVPSCTYCDPEVASVGLTEVEAKARGFTVEAGKFPFTALAKAAILGKTEGFVKIVRETEYDQVLGVHIVGAHATDLIAEACVALRIEATAEEIFRTMHAHPTLSEAMAEAALAASGRAVHV